MIEVVSGRGVGSGKSYYVTTRLVQHWAVGGTAYVTDSMEVVWAEVKKLALRRYGVVLEDDQLCVVDRQLASEIHYHTRPGTAECPVLIVLDEVQDVLNARDWSEGMKKGREGEKGGKRSMFDWLCQSRHDDNDLIFISQAAENIDKQVRRLITYQRTVRNSVNFPLGFLGTLQKCIQAVTFGLNDGKYFIVSQFDQDGRTLLSKQWVRHDRAIYKCYVSKAMAGKHRRAGGAIAKKQLKQVKANKPMIRVVVVAVVVMLFGGGWWLFHRGNPMKPAIVADRTELATTAESVRNGRPDARLEKDAGGVRYEVLTAPWRTRGPGFVRIPEGLLCVGRMSKFGFVQVVSDDGVVRILKPDNGLLYIVTEDEAPSPVMSLAVAGAAPAKK